MSKNKFKEPKITINRVYTRKGDKGNTTLIGGYKVSKDSLRVCAFGEIDELNVAILAHTAAVKLKFGPMNKWMQIM